MNTEPKEIKTMWDVRFSEEGYAYGTEPNEFLKSVIDSYELTGSMLFPAEGEGRNAVYAATQGLDVTAFDISEEGRKKAMKLAAEKNVSIDYEIGNLSDLELSKKEFDSAALIFAHFPVEILTPYHKKIAELIKPGGILILEGFSKSHLPLRLDNPAVGGPGNIDMLFSLESIQNDFSDFEVLMHGEVQVELSEGKYHNGTANVIRFIGRKKEQD
ncbi:MAG: class I SAM-dependent methyltransferase [Chlorobiota bacterium]